MECEIVFEAKSYDIDFAGIASNIAYHRWLEDLRIAVIAQVKPVHELAGMGFTLALVQTLIDFKAPIHLGDRIRGRQAITRIGNTSIVFETEMTRADSGVVVAAARQTAVILDEESRHPSPVPDFLRQLVTKPSFKVSIHGVDAPV